MNGKNFYIVKVEFLNEFVAEVFSENGKMKELFGVWNTIEEAYSFMVGKSMDIRDNIIAYQEENPNSKIPTIFSWQLKIRETPTMFAVIENVVFFEVKEVMSAE